MLAAFSLIVLNMRGYYAGSIAARRVTAFQFSAKFLEILTQASLVAMLFALIRHEVLSERNLPLGSLLLPLRIADISYLWSLDFWGLSDVQQPPQCASNHHSGSYSPSCARGTDQCCIAVLLIPRQISYPAEKFLMLLDEASTVFP